MECTYKLTVDGKVTEFDSHSDLIEYLDDLCKEGRLDLSELSDVVFSKLPRQQALVEKLDKLKAEYKPVLKKDPSVSAVLDGTPESEGYTITNFFDSPSCILPNGESLIRQLNIEEYKAVLKKKLVKDLNMSEEEADKEINTMVENWGTILEDSFNFHKLFTSDTIKSDNDLAFIQNAEKLLPSKLYDPVIANKLYTGLHDFYVTESGKYDSFQHRTNINLTATIKGLDKKVFGHIDHMFIGQDGTLHLYLFKTSSQHHSQWVTEKKKKYKYQLAFLKQMLLQNGVNVKNMTLSIVPVHMVYNDDYTKLTNIQVNDVIEYSTNPKTGGYAMHKYDRNTKAFIDSSIIPKHISNEHIERAKVINRAIFPDLNIREDGLDQSARLWIRYAPSQDPNGTAQLLILEVGEKNHGYNVIIAGKTYKIKSNKSKNNNPEILEVVKNHLDDLESSKSYITQKLREAILNSYSKGFPTFHDVKGLAGAAITLEAALRKYVTATEEGGTKYYEWELLDNLLDSNILLFRNKDTKVVDAVSLTSFDLNALPKMSKGSNILGCHRMDSEFVDMQGTFGNIEAIRTMTVLNQITPLFQDVKFGTLNVVSTSGMGAFRKHDIGELNKNYYNNIIKVVNEEEADLKAENNFVNAQFADPVDAILEDYTAIMEGKSDLVKDAYDTMGFKDLREAANVTSANSNAVKTQALYGLMDSILNKYPSFNNPAEVEKAINNGSKHLRDMARLYTLITKAYLNLSGETPQHIASLDKVDLIEFTSTTVPDPNIRIVVDNLLITHDTIASEFLGKFDKDIRPTFYAFYRANGYTNIQNMTIGDLVALFKNLYLRDALGKNKMLFKNPYDKNEDLKDHERVLLKNVLFQIAKINSNGNFPYSSPDAAGLAEYASKNESYLWVPLERASKATKRQSVAGVVAGWKNFWKKISHASEAFDEFVQGITSEERELLGKDDALFYSMTLKNPFSLSMSRDSATKRQLMIDKYGPDFFETNVENLMIDFLAKHISTTQLNKLLVTSKALLLQLHLTGNFSGNEDITQKEIKYILDYLKINVFNTSIMSPKEKKIIGVIQPIKKIVTDILLGGNVVSAIRDSLEGLQLNFIRSLIKLNTDITPKSVRKAYAYVATHSTSDAMAVNLLSKLCLKYRLSNTDVGRISERAKSGRNGIFNYDNWLYSTLRGPDFLNRMTLFVARCMEDGVWDAYSIDKDTNTLIYDWKKDLRFNLLATNTNTNSAEYKAQRALYMSKIRKYNLENGTNLNYDDDLPSPYSNLEIMNIRAITDNIYGAYDKSKKAMAENTSLGITFGMFTTWMNGIVNTYLMKPLKNGLSRLVKEQEIDEQGRKLFFTEEGNITTEDTGLPVYKNVPIIVLGILHTVLDLAALCKNGGIPAMKKYLDGNIVAKSNLRKLVSDLLIGLLLSSLFKFVLTPAYKEHKKNAANNPVLQNLVTEIVYKSSSRSYDLYKGLMNVLQFFGENMNPPTYSIPVQIFKETGLFLFGDKTWKHLLFDLTGFGRSAKDTFRAYIKGNE